MDTAGWLHGGSADAGQNLSTVRGKSPIFVMARGLMERVLGCDRIDELFDRVAQRQYTRERLFSRVFDLLSQVVCG